MLSFLFHKKDSLDKFISDKIYIIKDKQGSVRLTQFKEIYIDYCKIRKLPPVGDVRVELESKGYSISKIGNANIINGLREPIQQVECEKVELLKIYRDKPAFSITEIQTNPKTYRIEGVGISKVYDFKNKALACLFESLDRSYSKDFKGFSGDFVKLLYWTNSDINDLVKISKDFGIGYYRIPKYPKRVYILTKNVYEMFKSVGSFEEIKQTKNRSGKENACYKVLKEVFSDLIQQFKIDGTSYDVDYYSAKNKLAVEFLGDYYHGNLTIFKPKEMNQTVGKTFETLNKDTFERLKIIKSKGYNVCYIWEKEWDEFIKGNKKFKDIIIRL